ncbi:unnamed protein product, partial [marine sediment metagenome]
MAITLYQPRTGVIDNKSYESLYSKTFDDIRKRTDNVPREGAQFFSQRVT